MATTAIEWTDRTWNPVRGCTRVSDGCRHCYAERVAYRFSGAGLPYEGLARKVNGRPAWTGVLRHPTEDELLQPLSWRKPARVFVNSMSDLFHEALPDEVIDRVFAVMALAPRHTFQILTKRPFRMAQYVTPMRRQRIEEAGERIQPSRPPAHWHYVSDWSARLSTWPLPNVWLGVSCENQEAADARIPLLLQTPAAVRFVSAEPLLGPVDFSSWVWMKTFLAADGSGRIPTDELSWVIVGGESGPGARPCDVAWVRGIVKQCQAAAVPVFVKQLGARPVDSVIRWADANNQALGTIHDRKGGDTSEWPADLRVRAFPEVR